MFTAQDVYSNSVVSLPASERLRLATLILEDLSRTSAALLDYADFWSEQDLRDLAAYSSEFADCDHEDQ